MNKAIYIKYLTALRTKLIEKYDELGLRASGSYEDGLEYEINNDTLTMYGAFHSQFMERGRDSGKFPPLEEIENWIETKKGLPREFVEKKKQFAFIIARKIAAEGIVVPNKNNKGEVIKSVVDDFLANDLYDMLEEIGFAYSKQIRSDVISIFKQVA